MDCNGSTALVGDVDDGRGCALCVGRGYMGTELCTFSFAVNLKVLEKLVY